MMCGVAVDCGFIGRRLMTTTSSFKHRHSAGGTTIEWTCSRTSIGDAAYTQATHRENIGYNVSIQRYSKDVLQLHIDYLRATNHQTTKGFGF